MRSILIDGVERANVARVETMRITTKAGGDGEAGLGEVTLEDFDGSLIDDANRPDIRKTWLATEDATASPTVLGFGRIGDFETARHSPNDYVDRWVDWKLILEDGNIELRGFDVHGQARPAETDYARVQWVASTYLNGSPRASTVLDYTTLVPNTNTVTMEAKTYNNFDVLDVLHDCCEQADKIVFVTVDAELFYDQKDSTAYTSSISISDRPADVNQTTVFEPLWDQGPALTWEGQTYASRLRLGYGSEQSVLVGPDAGEADHDYWVGRTFNSDPLSTAQATAIADGELGFRAKGVRTYSLSLLLANDQVDLIKVGQRIQIKARAAVDADNAYVYRRIAQLQWEVESPEYYLAHLQLDQPITAHSKNQRGTPLPRIGTWSPQDPCVVGATSDEFTDSGDWDGYVSPLGPTWEETDGTGALIWYPGTAFLPAMPDDPVAPLDHKMELDFGIGMAFPLDFTVLSSMTSPALGNPAALSYIFYVTDDAEVLGFHFDYGDSFGSMSIDGIANLHVYVRWGPGAFQIGEDTVAVPGEWTQGRRIYTRVLAEAARVRVKAWFEGNDQPEAWLIDLETGDLDFVLDDWRYFRPTTITPVNAPGGDVRLHSICIGDGLTGSTECGTCVPANGDFVAMVPLTYGDGTRLAFSALTPYEPGSLSVEVDGLGQHVTETDPSIGSFTLDFAPNSDELVSASWRAA